MSDLFGMIWIFILKAALTAIFFTFLMVVGELFSRIDDAGGLKGVTYCLLADQMGMQTKTSGGSSCMYMILFASFMVGVWL